MAVAVQDPPEQQPPQSQPAQQLLKAAAAGQAAKAAVVTPAVAVTLPARAAVGAVAVPAEAFVHGVKIAVILKVLRKLLRWHTTDSTDWLTKELTRLYPDADPAVIRAAVENEMKLERLFQQKALKRVTAALQAAGELPTLEEQQAKVQAILKLEQHYADLREKVMLERAKTHIENAGVKAESPEGARWNLGPAKNHTAGCVALAGKNWPWSVLDAIQPPLHPGCPCYLSPLKPGDTVPAAGDALNAAKAALALEEAIRAVADPGEIEAFLNGLEIRPSVARAISQLQGVAYVQEAKWKDFLHPRSRKGEWIDKPGGTLFDFGKHDGPKPPHVASKPYVSKADEHMPKLSAGSTVVSGAERVADTTIGGETPEPAKQKAIPDFGHIPLTLHLPPQFGSDSIKAKDGLGEDYIVKDHSGDRTRVASELLSNGVYRELGINTPTMGHIKTAPEPDFSKRADDLPNEPPIDAAPHARISTGIILREPDGRLTVIEPRNHYGGYIHTFPKGGVEPNLTPQQNAHKELWEETGLHAHITGVVGDFKGDTGTSRFYSGVRTGGEPTPSDETQAIKTVTPDEAAKMLNKQRDQEVLKAALDQPVPTGAPPADQFPPKEAGRALAFKTVGGKTRNVTEPNEALGQGYMADALLANRDFLGDHGANVRWQNDNTPVRVNMASTLGYGRGGKHDFSGTPEEVWKMRYRGQAAGTIPQSEDALRQQAAHIVRTLTDAKIEELTKAANFPNKTDREQLAATLKARVAWMRRFATGEESLPTPASGAEARTLFTDAQDKLEVYPEESQAIDNYGTQAGRTLDDHLRSGKDFTDPERQTTKRLDAVLDATNAPEDTHVFMGADAAPNQDMVGKTFSMKSYIRAHTDMGNAAGNTRVRLTVPGGSRMLHLDDAQAGEPDMLLPRGQRMQTTGLSLGPDGVQQLDAVLLPYSKPRSLPSAYKPPSQTSFSGVKPPAAPSTSPWKKGDRVVINGNKATVTGTPGGPMVNVKLDSGKGYTVPHGSLTALQEAAWNEPLHPRGRGGQWVTSELRTAQAKDAAAAAADAIRHATGGDVVPMHVTQLPDDDTATARSRRGNVIALHEDSAPGTQTSAIVHEYAHGIDRARNEDDWFTQTPEFDPLYKALMASPTVKKLKADEIQLMKGDDRGRAGLLQGRELLARAFEQYVAERGGNSMLAERMRKLIADPLLGFQHWQPDEFKPIAAELEKALPKITAPAKLQEADTLQWVEEATYAEALHPRGRGGKWTRKLGAPAHVSAPHLPEVATDTIIGSLKGKHGPEAYNALASGEATDTQKLHQTEGKYTLARQVLHQQVIDHFFKDAKPVTGSKPKAIFTAGGAASGKSTLAGQSSHKEANLDIPAGAVYINPDDIKALLPEYEALKKQGREDVAAAATHEESSDLAKLMTGLAMDGHYPMIVDGTGDSHVGKFGRKLQAAHDAGYHVEARYAHVPVAEAITREQDRAKRTGRKVAERLLREQHQTVAQGYTEDVVKRPDIHVKVYSTVKRGRPQLIAEKPAGKDLQVTDKQQYAEHIAKAHPTEVTN